MFTVEKAPEQPKIDDEQPVQEGDTVPLTEEEQQAARKRYIIYASGAGGFLLLILLIWGFWPSAEPEKLVPQTVITDLVTGPNRVPYCPPQTLGLGEAVQAVLSAPSSEVRGNALKRLFSLRSFQVVSAAIVLLIVLVIVGAVLMLRKEKEEDVEPYIRPLPKPTVMEVITNPSQWNPVYAAVTGIIGLVVVVLIVLAATGQLGSKKPASGVLKTPVTTGGTGTGTTGPGMTGAEPKETLVDTTLPKADMTGKDKAAEFEALRKDGIKRAVELFAKVNEKIKSKQTELLKTITDIENAPGNKTPRVFRNPLGNNVLFSVKCVNTLTVIQAFLVANKTIIQNGTGISHVPLTSIDPYQCDLQAVDNGYALPVASISVLKSADQCEAVISALQNIDTFIDNL